MIQILHKLHFSKPWIINCTIEPFKGTPSPCLVWTKEVTKLFLSYRIYTYMKGGKPNIYKLNFSVVEVKSVTFRSSAPSWNNVTGLLILPFTILSEDFIPFLIAGFRTSIFRLLLIFVGRLTWLTDETCMVDGAELFMSLPWSGLEEACSGGLTNFPCFGCPALLDCLPLLRRFFTSPEA